MKLARSVLAMALLLAGCSARDCNGSASSLPESLPAAATVDHGAAMALSPLGINTLLPVWKGALTSAFVTPIAVTIPQTSGPAGMTVCPGTCSASVTFGSPSNVRGCVDAVANLGVSVVAKSVRFSFQLNFSTSRLLIAGPTNYCFGLSGPRCDLDFNTARAGSCANALTGTISLTLDTATRASFVETAFDPSHVASDSSDVLIDGINVCGDIWCGVADIATARDVLNAALRPPIEARIRQVVDGALCRRCADATACPAGTRCAADGTCRLNQRCVADIGLQGRFDLRAVLGQGVRSVPASSIDVDQVGAFSTALGAGVGLDLASAASSAMVSGVAYRDSCIPDRPGLEPSLTASPPAGLGASTDPRGQASDVALGMSRAYLDRLGWSVWRSGALCLDSAPALDAERLALLLPSIATEFVQPTSPVRLRLRPQAPPSFALGANTVVVDSTSGAARIGDALASITWPGLELEVSIDSDPILRLSTDIKLRVAGGLATDKRARVLWLLDDVEVGSVRVVNRGLVREDDAALAAAARPLYALALASLSPLLTDGDLPSVLKRELVPTGVPLAIGAGQYAAVYARLGSAPTPGVPATTQIKSVVVEKPATGGLTALALAAGGPAPRLRVELSGTAPGAGALEWSVRIDGGAWRPFTSAASLVLDAAALAVQGTHTLAARARKAGAPETLDLVGATQTFVVDASAPKVTLTAAGGALVATAHDAISPDAELRYAFRVDGGSYSAPSASPSMPEPASYTSADVEVTDAHGNVGTAHYEPIEADAGVPDGGAGQGGLDSGSTGDSDGGADGRADADGADADGADSGAAGGGRENHGGEGGCGCRNVPGHGDGAFPVLAIGAFIAFAARRRRHRT